MFSVEQVNERWLLNYEDNRIERKEKMLKTSASAATTAHISTDDSTLQYLKSTDNSDEQQSTYNRQQKQHMNGQLLAMFKHLVEIMSTNGSYPEQYALVANGVGILIDRVKRKANVDPETLKQSQRSKKRKRTHADMSDSEHNSSSSRASAADYIIAPIPRKRKGNYNRTRTKTTAERITNKRRNRVNHNHY